MPLLRVSKRTNNVTREIEKTDILYVVDTADDVGVGRLVTNFNSAKFWALTLCGQLSATKCEKPLIFLRSFVILKFF